MEDTNKKLEAIIEIFNNYNSWAIKNMGLRDLYIDWINDELDIKKVEEAYDKLFQK